MKWYRYSEKQPEDQSIIVQIDRPDEDFYKVDFKRHYCMGMRKYTSWCTYANYKQGMEEMGGKPYEFWWCYAKDFPFPEETI